MGNPGAEELMQDLTRVRRAVRRRLRERLPQPRLPASQVEVLQLVEEQPGAGVSTAARALHLADNSVSGLVNQLVAAGLLRRDTDPRDRRAARLFLTQTAAGRLASWRAARADLVETGLAGLSPGERAAIAGALPALRHLAELMSTGAGASGDAGDAGDAADAAESLVDAEEER